MKNLLLTTLVLLFFGTIASSQPIPADRMYLGQTLPDNTPRIFSLSVSTGTFATERITISDDNKEIYYSEIKSYYPISAAKTKYYSYTEGKWMGPLLLFEDYCAPALSVNGDAMYLEDSNFKTYLSVRKGQKWSAPLPNFIQNRFRTLHAVNQQREFLCYFQTKKYHWNRRLV